DPLVHCGSPDIHELSVPDTRGTGGLAAPARQASVKVQLCRTSRPRTLQHLLDLIDAATRAVELIAEQLIGRAGGEAEAAMNARAQDLLRPGSVGSLSDPVRKTRLHGSDAGQKPAGVEDPLRIEARFQSPVNLQDCRRQRMKPAGRGLATPTH